MSPLDLDLVTADLATPERLAARIASLGRDPEGAAWSRFLRRHRHRLAGADATTLARLALAEPPGTPVHEAAARHGPARVLRRVGGTGDDPGDGLVLSLGAMGLAHQAVAVPSPDGALLAARRVIDLVVWDAATGATRGTFEGNEFTATAWSPAGHRLAYANPAHVIVRDVDTGARVVAYAGHRGAEVRAIAFHPDGERVLSHDARGHVHLWRLANGRTLARWAAHPGERPRYWTYEELEAVAGAAYGLAFLDGDAFASVGPAADRLALWDLDAAEPRRALKSRTWRLVPGGRYALKQEGDTLTVVALPDGRVLHRVRGAQAGALHPDGRRAALGTTGRVRVLDLATGEVVATVTVPGHLLALMPGDGLVAAVARGELVQLWDLAATDGSAPPAGPARVVGFDGQRLVVLDGGGLSWRDLATGAEARTEVPSPASAWGPATAVQGASFAPGGDEVLVGCRTVALRWRPADGAVRTIAAAYDHVETWPLPGRFPWCLQTPDVPTEEAAPACVEVPSGRVRWESRHADDSVRPLAGPITFVPGTGLAVTGDGAVLDLDDGVVTAPSVGDTRGPLAVSPDGRYLAVATPATNFSLDATGTRVAWSGLGGFVVRTLGGAAVRAFSGHVNVVHRVLFVGDLVASFDENGEGKLWRLDGTCLRTVDLGVVPGHIAWVGGACVAYDHGGAVVVRDLAADARVAAWPLDASLVSLAVAGDRVALGDAAGTVDVLAVAAPAPAALPAPVPVAAEEGAALALAGPAAGAVRRALRVLRADDLGRRGARARRDVAGRMSGLTRPRRPPARAPRASARTTRAAAARSRRAGPRSARRRRPRRRAPAGLALVGRPLGLEVRREHVVRRGTAPLDASAVACAQRPAS